MVSIYFCMELSDQPAHIAPSICSHFFFFLLSYIRHSRPVPDLWICPLPQVDWFVLYRDMKDQFFRFMKKKGCRMVAAWRLTINQSLALVRLTGLSSCVLLLEEEGIRVEVIPDERWERNGINRQFCLTSGTLSRSISSRCFFFHGSTCNVLAALY